MELAQNQENEIKRDLIYERDSYQSNLQDMRRERVDKTLDYWSRYDQFCSRLGELSFAVAVAITPVILLSRNEAVYREYLFLGLLFYILVGLYSVYRTKNRLEEALDYFPSMGIELETEISKIVISINKLLSDVGNDKYIRHYIENREDFVEKGIAKAEEKMKINFTSDILIIGFIVATMLSIRSIWTFSNSYYISIFGGVMIFLLISSFFSTTPGQEKKKVALRPSQKFVLIEKLHGNTRLLCEIARVSRAGYYKWQKNQGRLPKDHDDYLLIKEIFDKGKAKWGWRTIQMKLLNEYGITMNHKKIERIKNE